MGSSLGRLYRYENPLVEETGFCRNIQIPILRLFVDKGIKEVTEKGKHGNQLSCVGCFWIGWLGPKNAESTFRQRGDPAVYSGLLGCRGGTVKIGAAAGPEINGRTVREIQTDHGAHGLAVRVEEVRGLADDVGGGGGDGDLLDAGKECGSRNGHDRNQNYLVFRFLLVGVGRVGGDCQFCCDNVSGQHRRQT